MYKSISLEDVKNSLYEFLIQDDDFICMVSYESYGLFLYAVEPLVLIQEYEKKKAAGS